MIPLRLCRSPAFPRSSPALPPRTYPFLVNKKQGTPRTVRAPPVSGETNMRVSP